LKGNLRHSMAWLHTWCGLACGWLLCAIFLTGSLSVFREPITRWMQAQPLAQVAQTTVASDGQRMADQAAQYLQAHASGARLWRVQLPQHAGEPVGLLWRDAAAIHQVALSPDNGLPVAQGLTRDTEGGRHFMSFHYMLHLPVLGFWLVGWLTIGLLVALISGVIIHRRIFLDFFTFRPGSGPRAWLDAHNATAVMTLPFLLMIAFTGLAIFYTSYMPWPLQAVYGSDSSAYSRFQSELSNKQASTVPHNPASNTSTPPTWSQLLHQARTLTGQQAQMLLIQNPGTPRMTLRVMGQAQVSPASPNLFTPQASVVFDASGTLLQVQRPDPETLSTGDQVYGVIKSLHVVDFGGWSMKWLYFISGLLGMLMMAAGTLLFSIKRRIKSQGEFEAATARIYRVVEALNVACIVGIGIACIAYFYANRLLPVELHGRAQWEIRSFLLIWLATLLHALLRPVRQAWTEQLTLAALLCLGLPLINRLTTGQDITRYLAVGDWQRASVEAVSVTLGLMLIGVWLTLERRQRTARKPPSPTPEVA